MQYWLHNGVRVLVVRLGVLLVVPLVRVTLDIILFHISR
jgi:hypothetical protein